MEDNRLSSLLAVLAVLFSALSVLLTITGMWLFLEYLVVSGVAFAGWLLFSFTRKVNIARVMSSYILSIIALLVLNTCRYSSDFYTFIFAHYRTWFLPSYFLNYSNWFIYFVCLPVSLLLLGGYFLLTGFPVGRFFLWWCSVYAVFESVIQFKIEMGNMQLYKHTYFLGLYTAMALFIIGVKALLYLIKTGEEEEIEVRNLKKLTTKQINLWSIFFVSIVAVYGITIYVHAGFLPVGIIVGSMMGGLIGWRKTTARSPTDRYKLTPLLLLLLTLFYIHVGEETLTNFNLAISSITGTPWSDKNFNYIITFVGPVVWVFGAYSLWKGKAPGNFILWFLIVGMILGEPTHLLVFPVVRMFKDGVRYQYFSGMYTALFPMIPAILALVAILKDHRGKTKAQVNV